MQHKVRHGILEREPALHGSDEATISNANPPGIFLERNRASIDHNCGDATSVYGLLNSRSPTAVARLISSSVVHSLESRAVGPLPHISKESLKRFRPALTDANSDASIPGVASIGGVFAATASGQPRRIGRTDTVRARGVTVAKSLVALELKAAATFDGASRALQFCGATLDGLATIATQKPDRTSSVLTYALEHLEPFKPFSRQIMSGCHAPDSKWCDRERKQNMRAA